MRWNSSFLICSSIACDIGLHTDDRAVIVLGDRHVEQFARIGQAAADAIERADDEFQPRALATQFLRLVRRAPDARVFQFAS